MTIADRRRRCGVWVSGQAQDSERLGVGVRRVRLWPAWAAKHDAEPGCSEAVGVLIRDASTVRPASRRQKLPLAKRAIGSSLVCVGAGMPREPVEARMICTLPFSSACCACRA